MCPKSEEKVFFLVGGFGYLSSSPSPIKTLCDALDFEATSFITDSKVTGELVASENGSVT